MTFVTYETGAGITCIAVLTLLLLLWVGSGFYVHVFIPFLERMDRMAEHKEIERKRKIEDDSSFN